MLMIGFMISFAIFELYTNNAIGNAIDADIKVATVIANTDVIATITGNFLSIVALSEQQFFCFSLTFGKISTRTWYASLSYAPLPLPKRQKIKLEVYSNA